MSESSDSSAMDLMVLYARLGRIVKTPEDMDFCEESDLRGMLNMAKIVESIDTSNVTEDDLIALRSVQQGVMRKDEVTEKTVHIDGYLQAVKVMPE